MSNIFTNIKIIFDFEKQQNATKMGNFPDPYCCKPPCVYKDIGDWPHEHINCHCPGDEHWFHKPTKPRPKPYGRSSFDNTLPLDGKEYQDYVEEIIKQNKKRGKHC